MGSVEIRFAAGPNHWNDLDMMEVGNGMSTAEDRSHFAMWNILSSPLILGNDLRTANANTINLLTNTEVLSINKDSLGIQGFRVSNKDDLEIWVKPLSNGSWAMAFINMSDIDFDLNYDWQASIIEDSIYNRKIDSKNKTYTVRDLFAHKDLVNSSQNLKTKIKKHDVLLILVEERN